MKNLPSLFSIILFSFGVFLVPSCQKDNEKVDCGEEPKQYEFIENRHLDIQYPTTQTVYPSVRISEGDSGKIIFQYLRYVDESACPWSDGGQGDWIVFEVDENLTEFNFENEDLLGANALAGGYSGFAGSFLMQPVQQGKITGEKQSQSEWQISVDISLNNRSYKLEKKFKRQ